jgi:hypothetical protein
MKKILIYTLLFIQAIIIVSCNPEFLKEEPASFLTIENKFANTKDFDMALTGVYQTLGQRSTPILNVDPTWGSYAYGLLATGELGTDEMYAAQKNRQEEILIDAYTISPYSIPIVAQYAVMNLGISRANQITTRLDTVSNPSGTQNAILGETLFLRSLFYFNLVRSFGGVPLILEPLTASNWQLHTKRDSIQTVYTKIIADLQRADLLLASTSRNSEVGRANNVAVQALLAKVYLHAASMKTNAALDEALKLNGINSYDWVDAADFYQKSATCIETALQRKGVSLTAPLDAIAYTSNFWPNENGPESIFEIQFINSTTDNLGGLIGQAFGKEGFVTVGRRYIKPCSRQYYVSSELNDTRYKQNVTKDQYITTTGQIQPASQYKSYGFIKFHNGWDEIKTGSTFGMTNQNLPVIRVADLCLMYAEAKAEISAITGNTADMQTAVNMLNSVRRRARGTDINTLVDIPMDFVTNNIPSVTTQTERNTIYKYLKPIPGIISMSFSGSDVGDLSIAPGELDAPVKRMRALVMNERKWELIGEGHRWYDLVRMGWLKKVCDAIDFTYMSGNPDDIPNLRGVKSHHVFRPIPQREVDMGMQQNAGY